MQPASPYPLNSKLDVSTLRTVIHNEGHILKNILTICCVWRSNVSECPCGSRGTGGFKITAQEDYEKMLEKQTGERGVLICEPSKTSKRINYCFQLSDTFLKICVKITRLMVDDTKSRHEHCYVVACTQASRSEPPDSTLSPEAKF